MGSTKDPTEQTMEIVQHSLDVKFQSVGPLIQCIKLSIPALKPLSHKIGECNATLVIKMESDQKKLAGRKRRSFQEDEVGPVMNSIVGCKPEESPQKNQRRTGQRTAVVAKVKHLVS